VVIYLHLLVACLFAALIAKPTRVRW